MQRLQLEPVHSSQRHHGGHARTGGWAACSTRRCCASLPDALRKLDPRTLWRNPVMFIVEIGAVWSTVLAVMDSTWFAWLIVFWLWLTVLFANLAEAVAEGRGKAQADTLRKAKTDTMARRLPGWTPGTPGSRGGRPGATTAAGRHRRRRGRRNHPRRRRHRGRHCVGG